MKLFLLTGIILLANFSVFAQVQYIPGPALENNRDATMNRMLAGDNDNFYCFRIRAKGRGTSLFVEKYDNKKLQPVFSKEIPFAADGERTRLEDIFYANNNRKTIHTNN